MTADWLYLLVLASVLLLVGGCALFILTASFRSPEHAWLAAYEQAYVAMQRGLEMAPEGLDPGSRDGTSSPTQSYAGARAGRRAAVARFR